MNESSELTLMPDFRKEDNMVAASQADRFVTSTETSSTLDVEVTAEQSMQRGERKRKNMAVEDDLNDLTLFAVYILS